MLLCCVTQRQNMISAGPESDLIAQVRDLSTCFALNSF